MPVRIYDISKKLGLENKEVLSKAKELGIAAARVASSSLDKITAEYLEDQLKQAHPERSAPPPPAPAQASPPQAPPEVPLPIPEPAVAPIAVIEPGIQNLKADARGAELSRSRDPPPSRRLPAW